MKFMKSLSIIPFVLFSAFSLPAFAGVDEDIQALDADTEKERTEAVKRLVAAGKPASPQLLAALKDKMDAIRAGAADALGQIRETSAVGPLIEMLNTDTGGGVRWKAAEALGRLADKSALPALQEHLKDDVEDNDNVQIYSGVSIARLCGKQEIPHLVDLLEREEQTIRKMAIDRLYYLTLVTLGYNPKDKLAARKEGVAKWRAWWDENKDKLDQIGVDEKWEKEAETLTAEDMKPAEEVKEGPVNP
jgi:hypothetical protein